MDREDAMSSSQTFGGRRQSDADAGTGGPGSPTRWERPRILFREPLEAVAVACVPTVDEGGPGKPDTIQCASPQS